MKRRLGGDPGQVYYLYVPGDRRTAPGGLFVAIHGISRNAREHARRFAPFAERYGVTLVAPRFRRDRFPDYQRLGREGRGERADQVLQRIVDEVQALNDAHGAPINLFGFSGGGQFAHRFAMAYPGKVARLVIGAAGWYTFPDACARYPRGIKASPALDDVRFDPTSFLRVPACVLVGSLDETRDEALNTSRRVDRQQGETRRVRGRNWARAMRRGARALGLDTQYRFEELPGVGHDFTQAMKLGCLGERTFGFLFGDPPPQRQPEATTLKVVGPMRESPRSPAGSSWQRLHAEPSDAEGIAVAAPHGQPALDSRAGSLPHHGRHTGGTLTAVAGPLGGTSTRRHSAPRNVRPRATRGEDQAVAPPR